MKVKRILITFAFLMIFVVENIVAADLSDGSMILNKDSYVFKGKEVTPKAVVYCDGQKLKKNDNYSIKYENNNNIGMGSIIATGKGQYSNGIKSEFLINPQKVKIKKIVPTETGFEALWKENKYVDGYEIEYAQTSYFFGSMVMKIEGSKNTSFKASNLRPNAKYYVRLRSYKVVDNKFYYSVWSKPKKYIKPFYKKDTYMVIDLSGGPETDKYTVSYLDSVPSDGWTMEYKTYKMVLRLVDPGTFIMGSPEDELGHYNNETQHEVTITKPFYIGIFQVTQKQYELITGSNPSQAYKGDARPANYVSYNMIRGASKGAGWPSNNEVDEESFIGLLRSKLEMSFDLPTEAQWEYACRAGTTTALNSGKNLTNTNMCPNVAEVARYYYNQDDGIGGYSEGCTTVGSYLPNYWGLYDMHGNVWEWCLDWYKADLGYSSVIDPVGENSGIFRVLRGGSFGNMDVNRRASLCRSASRCYFNLSTPDLWMVTIGFRIVITL